MISTSSLSPENCDEGVLLPRRAAGLAVWMAGWRFQVALGGPQGAATGGSKG